MGALAIESQRLLEASMAKSSHSTYSRGVNSFDAFRVNVGFNQAWPAPVQHIVAFIAHMSLEGKAPSTINTYVSAISYNHKVNGWVDPTDNFIVHKLKEGCKRLNGRVDGRIPITLNILEQLVRVLPNVCNSSYETALFKASFLLAFFGFLRVGEFTCISKRGDASRVLGIGDIKSEAGGKSVEVTIRYSKTDQSGRSTTLVISARDGEFCQVRALANFTRIRPHIGGQLFVHFGGDPLTRYQFDAVLKKGAQLLGLPLRGISPHSFRIGAATSAAICDMSVEEIKSMGRWQSAAVKIYIRPHLMVEPITGY